LSRHFAMLMPSPPALPAAAAEAEDEESRPQARLASRILSARACGWTGLSRSTAAAWSKSSLPTGLSIRRWPPRTRSAEPGTHYQSSDLPVPQRTQPAGNGRPPACFFLGTSSPSRTHSPACRDGGATPPAAQARMEGLCAAHGPSARLLAGTESAFRANSALAGPPESITLRDKRQGSDARPPAAHADGVLHAYGLECLRDPDSRAGRRMLGVSGRWLTRGPQAVRDQRFDRLADRLAGQVAVHLPGPRSGPADRCHTCPELLLCPAAETLPLYSPRRSYGATREPPIGVRPVPVR
jgi:hypothetical protein